MRRVSLPPHSADKLNMHELEFSHMLNGDEPIPIRYHPDEDWIEVPDEFTEEQVLDTYHTFEHDELYALPDHHKRAVELLEKDDLTQAEEHELQKLERNVLRDLLRERQ